MPSSGDIAGLLIVAMAIAFTGWATIRLASTRIDTMNEKPLRDFLHEPLEVRLQRGSEGTLARFNGRRFSVARCVRPGYGWSEPLCPQALPCPVPSR
jgi:hypothetical protein